MSENLIRTMSGQITARIREKILTGVYPPGSALLQDVIAAEFGVSKIPVREALVQLRAEGLVDVFAHSPHLCGDYRAYSPQRQTKSANMRRLRRLFSA